MSHPRQSVIEPVSPGSDERGIALVVAIFALAIIGALVGTNVFAGQVEHQSGRNTFYASQAREAAEAGLAEAVGTLEAGMLLEHPAGTAPLDLGTLILGSGVSASRNVSRLTRELFLIRSRGIRQNAAGVPLATSTLGALVRVLPSTSAPDTVPAISPSGLSLAERGWIQL
ncbi:MAG: hypothetical protein ACREMZ_08190 [Gemmatimonadales bacterium]